MDIFPMRRKIQPFVFLNKMFVLSGWNWRILKLFLSLLLEDRYMFPYPAFMNSAIQEIQLRIHSMDLDQYCIHRSRISGFCIKSICILNNCWLVVTHWNLRKVLSLATLLYFYIDIFKIVQPRGWNSTLRLNSK